MDYKRWGRIDPDPLPEMVFRFSSFEHLGCAVYVNLPGVVDANVEVLAKRQRTAVKDLLGGIVDVVLGTINIAGKLFTEDNLKLLPKDQLHPFNITLRAYDPSGDVDYVAKILDVWITDVAEGSFSAASIIKWKPVEKTAKVDITTIRNLNEGNKVWEKIDD